MKKLQFDWTISMNTVVLIVSFLGTGATAFWRLETVEKRIVEIQENISRLNTQNNEAHMKIIEAAAKVATQVSEHIRYTTKVTKPKAQNDEED